VDYNTDTVGLILSESAQSLHKSWAVNAWEAGFYPIPAGVSF
jgi:hypothetical protein